MSNKKMKYDPLVFLKAAISVGSHHGASPELQKEARALRISLGFRKDRIRDTEFTCIAMRNAKSGMSWDEIHKYTHLYQNVALRALKSPFPSYWNKPATPENQQDRYNMMLLMAEIARTGL